MPRQREQTIRREIIMHLEASALTIREISQQVRIMEKEVVFHLTYIEKSLRSKKKKISVTPHACMGCGFEFKERKNYKKPGKCPECRGTRIGPAIYRITD